MFLLHKCTAVPGRGTQQQYSRQAFNLQSAAVLEKKLLVVCSCVHVSFAAAAVCLVLLLVLVLVRVRVFVMAGM